MICVMRSCGSMLPTRIPRSKSIHSLRNASPVGNSAPPSPRFASGSQSLADVDRFMALRLCVAEDALENQPAVFAAQQFLAGAFGMRHQAEHVASLVADARDVIERAVRVGHVRDLTVLRAVTKKNAVVAFELFNDPRFGEITAFSMRNRNAEHLAFATGVGERRISRFDANMNVFTDEFQSAITDKRAGQQVRFTENLKAVANADDQSARFRVFDDRLHRGREARDSART